MSVFVVIHECTYYVAMYLHEPNYSSTKVKLNAGSGVSYMCILYKIIVSKTLIRCYM